MRTKQPIFFILIVILAGSPLLRAQGVPPPPTPPTPPGLWCSQIYGELETVLQGFNQTMSAPPAWQPVSLGPTVFAANLQVADANTGPAIGGDGYLNSVLPQLYEEKALGAPAILIQIGFPALYAPFLTYEKLTPANYTGFYASLAQAIHGLGMKVIVENDILLTSDIQAGWGTSLSQYFATLNWGEYVAARASMAATIAETMSPDYLIVAEEPDTESAQANQPNLLNAADAAQMVQAEITAVRGSSFPNAKIGAGFGAWPQSSNANSIPEYTVAYVALPMDFLDSHIYPINVELEANGQTGPVINNILTIAGVAAAAGMPVAMSEYWAWKMENSEYNSSTADNIRGRNPFSFWAPIDQYMIQTMQALAAYSDFVFMAGDGPDYLFTYQNFAGTEANGGLTANSCGCAVGTAEGSPVYCDSYDIIQTETQQAKAANQAAQYSVTGFTLYNALVSPPDNTPPGAPGNVTASAGYTQASLSWSLATDNVGVAGYNVFRCQASALNGPCIGDYGYIGLTTIPSYTDPTLTQNTAYNYEIQAFDILNNNSPFSQPVSVQTARTSTSAPTSLTAAPVSAQEITITWTPPQSSGTSTYLIFRGNSAQSLQQIATLPSSKLTYNDKPLSPGTMYFYGVEAQAGGVVSPMSPLAWATTYALPEPPMSVTAVPASPTEVNLSWQEHAAKNGLPVSSYQVWQGNAAGVFTKVPGSVTGTTYTNRQLTPNTIYYYEIVAVDSQNDDSDASAPISVVTDSLPPAPLVTSVATPAATQVALTFTWSPAANGLAAARYEIFCGVTLDKVTQVGTLTATNNPKGGTYTWRAAAASQQYVCYVKTVDTSNSTGAQSNEISVTTPPMPNAPTSLAATTILPTKVILVWVEILPPNGLPIQSYSIFRGPTPDKLTSLVTRTTPTFTDLTVTAGQQFCYAIAATDTGRDVSPQSSPPLCVTP